VDLAAMDKNGKSDPYAVVTSTFNKQRFKSKVMKKTLNPVWNETYDLYGVPPETSLPHSFSCSFLFFLPF
jgi:hypothetical protein